jgi:hypothetical protein
MTLPDRLFKYLPSRFVPAVIERGEVLFRNLTYFRKSEHTGRRDLLEGIRLDFPGTDVTLETVDPDTGTPDGRIKVSRPMARMEAINPERVMVFCLSTRLDRDLFAEFEADSCLEIVNPEAFLDRVSRVVGRQKRFAGTGLLHRSVEYYSPRAAPPMPDLVPSDVAFVKHDLYRHRAEYRLVTSLTRGLQLSESFALPEHDLEEGLALQAEAHRPVFVGSLRDIAVVHSGPGSIHGAA